MGSSTTGKPRLGWKENVSQMSQGSRKFRKDRIIEED
jgi:hypothetical protein